MFKKLSKRLTFFSYNLEAPEYLENFIISAVVSIYVIRIFLTLTGYPQIGGQGLHIAHMLWGGILMMVAIILMLTYLNKEARQTGSVIGGIGFGIFIDELGKFITSDNNYYYQPTYSLLYILFALLFFGYKSLFSRIKIDKVDYTLNALELFKEVVFLNLDKSEKKKAISYLKKAGRENIVVKKLYDLIYSIEPSPDTEIHIMSRIKKMFAEKYLNVFRREKFARFIAIMFIIFSFVNISAATIHARLETLSFWDWGNIASSLVTGALTILGVYYLLKKKRLLAYLRIEQAVLVSIIFGHFFAFYIEQLSATYTLLVTVSIYIAIKYLIDQEKLLIKSKRK